jgi:hypothetical protein
MSSIGERGVGGTFACGALLHESSVLTAAALTMPIKAR